MTRFAYALVGAALILSMSASPARAGDVTDVHYKASPPDLSACGLTLSGWAQLHLHSVYVLTGGQNGDSTKSTFHLSYSDITATDTNGTTYRANGTVVGKSESLSFGGTDQVSLIGQGKAANLVLTFTWHYNTSDGFVIDSVSCG